MELFNHESPRRGETFVTQRLRALARIVVGEQKKTLHGQSRCQTGLGYAKDYVRAMWLMLQQSEPDDYVIATGKHTRYESSLTLLLVMSISIGRII